jgi:hypothetical protein
MATLSIKNGEGGIRTLCLTGVEAKVAQHLCVTNQLYLYSFSTG